MFKRFKVKDIFKLVGGKQPPKEDRFIEPLSGLVPAITGVTENNGIGFYTTKNGKMTYKNILTIAKDGEYAGTVYLQDQEVCLAGHSLGLIPKKDIDNKCLLYLASLFINYLRHGYWKINAQIPSVTYEKMDSVVIDIPVIENPNPDHKYTADDIDWQYMRDYIKELECDYIKELECDYIKELECDYIKELDAYLQATGLNDYELTEEDKKVLGGKNEVRFGEFKIENVFHKVELKRLKKIFDKNSDVSTECTKEYSLPLINAKNGDNGIMYYGKPYDWESDTYCIDIVNDGAISTGNVYPQPQRTGILYNAYMIKPNANIESAEVLMYLSKSIEKIIKGQYGYDNKATWDKVKHNIIYLPITQTGEPDFDYMERYIRAIEKIVIADVVKYKDKVIETTKKAVDG